MYLHSFPTRKGVISKKNLLTNRMRILSREVIYLLRLTWVWKGVVKSVRRAL